MSLMIYGQGKMAKNLPFTPLQVAPLCHLQTVSYFAFIPLITFGDYPVLCLLSPQEQGPCLTHCCIGPGT